MLILYVDLILWNHKMSYSCIMFCYVLLSLTVLDIFRDTRQKYDVGILGVTQTRNFPQSRLPVQSRPQCKYEESKDRTQSGSLFWSRKCCLVLYVCATHGVLFGFEKELYIEFEIANFIWIVSCLWSIWSLEYSDDVLLINLNSSVSFKSRWRKRCITNFSKIQI